MLEFLGSIFDFTRTALTVVFIPVLAKMVAEFIIKRQLRVNERYLAIWNHEMEAHPHELKDCLTDKCTVLNA